MLSLRVPILFLLIKTCVYDRGGLGFSDRAYKVCFKLCNVVVITVLNEYIIKMLLLM